MRCIEGWKYNGLLALLLLAAFGGRYGDGPAYSTKLSDGGFPTSEFFGGLVVDLDSLKDSDRYQTFPLDELVPADISFDHLDTNLITRFGLFLKPNGQSDRRKKRRFEIAAVAKLRNPNSFKPETDLTHWSNLTTPWQKTVKVEVEEVQVAGNTCFRFENGSVFNPIVSDGTIQFYDREGKKRDRGINIGNGSDMGYVSSEEKSKAVIVSEVSDANLIEDQLKFDLFLDVHLTSRQATEFAKAQAYLESSDGSLRSEPIAFNAVSLSKHRLSFPRQIPTLDSDSGKAKGTKDLIEEFVTDGKLKLVLRSLTNFSYLGLNEDDVGLRIVGHEYLGVVGEYVVVTQSLESLKQFITAGDAKIAEKLELQDGQQVQGSFQLSDPERLTAFTDFLDILDLKHARQVIPSSANSVRFSVDMNQQSIFSAHVGMSNSDREKLAAAVSHECKELTRPRSYRETKDFFFRPINEEGNLGLGVLPGRVFETLLRLDCMASLRVLGSNQITLGTPIDTPYSGEPALFPASSYDRLELMQPIQAMGEKIANSVSVHERSTGLGIEFRWPFAAPEALNDLDRTLIAVIRRNRAAQHHRQLRHYFTTKIERRVLSQFPGSLGLSRILAHQLSYNTSIEYDGYSNRYFWVREGIKLLLDSAQSSKSKTDSVLLLGTAAEFIGFKISISDEYKQFRPIFAKDHELLRQISKYVDLKQCVNAEGTIDSILVSKRLFEYCDQQIQKLELAVPSNERMWVLLKPNALRYRFAQRLDESFDQDSAIEQWQLAKRQLQQFQESEPAKGLGRYADQLEKIQKQINLRLSPVGMKVFSHHSKAEALSITGDKEPKLKELELGLTEICKHILEGNGEDDNEVAREVFSHLIRDAKDTYKYLEQPVPEEFLTIVAEN